MDPRGNEFRAEQDQGFRVEDLHQGLARGASLTLKGLIF